MIIKPRIINVSGYSNTILDFKKGFDKALKNIPAVSEVCWGLPGSVWKLCWSSKQ